MNYQKFEDLRVWQSARELYKATSEAFVECKMFFFRDQIMRAALSVSNNIAEGFERKTNKEWVYFLYVAKGSCGEVRSMLYLAMDQKIISETQKNEIMELSMKTSKMIGSLIETSKRNG
jgi:four helix bundle protein